MRNESYAAFAHVGVRNLIQQCLSPVPLTYHQGNRRDQLPTFIRREFIRVYVNACFMNRAKRFYLHVQSSLNYVLSSRQCILSTLVYAALNKQVQRAFYSIRDKCRLKTGVFLLCWICLTLRRAPSRLPTAKNSNKYFVSQK